MFVVKNESVDRKGRITGDPEFPVGGVRRGSLNLFFASTFEKFYDVLME